MKNNYLLGILRITIGLIFLWAFADKLFGLGFSTPAEKAWLSGNSPTAGFLKFGTEGVFGPAFQSLSGNTAIDWLFMGGLLAVGLSLIAGIGVKVAGYSGALMMLLIYLSVFPPENNPFIDQHIVYILLLLYFTKTSAGDTLGFGRWWSNQGLVKKCPFLK